MAKTTPGDFVRQVKQEGAKVTWPTPKEAGITSGMVFVMVVVMAVFFLVVDLVLNAGVQSILGFGA